MGLSVTFVSGLPGAGKSTIISMMIEHLWSSQPHYIRLVNSSSAKRPPKVRPKTAADCGVASARWVEYDDEHVFEILPEALTAIHRRDRYGSVVLEADADNALRHAYPYDYRVFVMPIPSSVTDVFREPARAAEELKRAMDDTAAFASEIFGLFSDSPCEDSDPVERRQDFTQAQMRGFLYSPLGDELATRIQLQQPYHGLVESDVILVNTSVGVKSHETAHCLVRIERLLERLGRTSGEQVKLFLCDPRDLADKTCKRLLKSLEPMCYAGK